MPDWDLFQTFWDFEPSWQNSIAAIQRKIEHFTILGIYNENALVGYGLIEIHTGDIPQLAISKSHRRMGLATKLLSTLVEHCTTDLIKIINTAADYVPFKEFAGRIKLEPGFGQYEMQMRI